jgi:DnaJ-class molecular chaperone
MKFPISNMSVSLEKLYNNTYTALTCTLCNGTGEDPYDAEEIYPCGRCEGLGSILLKKIQDYKLIKPMFTINNN